MSSTRIPPPPPGLYYGVPFAEYQSWDAFRKSDVPGLLRSPLHWLWEQNHPRESAEMVLGSMVDCLICDGPAEFDAQFAVRPDTYVSETTAGRGENKVVSATVKPWTMQSKTCKAMWAELQKFGKTIISADDVETARDAADALRLHPRVVQWLTRGKKQVSMVSVDAETGVTCKGRLDLLVMPQKDGGQFDDLLGDQSESMIVDFKTTQNADRGAFRRLMTNFGYHIQGGLYVDMYATLTQGEYLPYYLAAVETSGPFGVAVYPLGPDSLATGLKRAREAMAVWKSIRGSGHYPGYPVFNEQLDVSAWAIDPDLREVGLGG